MLDRLEYGTFPLKRMPYYLIHLVNLPVNLIMLHMLFSTSSNWKIELEMWTCCVVRRAPQLC